MTKTPNFSDAWNLRGVDRGSPASLKELKQLWLMSR
jgi:hypothetical protein